MKDTGDKLLAAVKKSGMELTGQTELPTGNGTVWQVCNPNWMGNLLSADENLIGLLPCSIVVMTKNNQVFAGVGSPTVLGSVSRNPAISQIASQSEKVLKDLINEAAGAEPLKPTKTKLFSTTTCPYCKMEAAWLTDKKIKFEEVHVDQNQSEAEKMVASTGQMGVPVTEIEYDNGETEYVIGFDKSKLESVFGEGGQI